MQEFIGWLKRKAEAGEKSLLERVQAIALTNMLEGKDGLATKSLFQ